MKRTIREYQRFANTLLQDRPIFAANQRDIVCYRKSDEREREAAQLINELAEDLENAIDDLREYGVCGTCAFYCHYAPNKKRCYKNKSYTHLTKTSPACSKWLWRRYTG